MMDDELVRYRAGKTPAPAFAVEPKQVVAIDVGFVDPQFADHAAIGQRLVHLGSPQRQSPRLAAFPAHAAPRIVCGYLYGAMQQKSGLNLVLEALMRQKRIASKGLPQLLCAI